MNWLHEIKLSDKAANVRRGLSSEAFASLQRSAERFALVSHRPIGDIAERLLAGVGAATDGDGIEPLLEFVADMIEDAESEAGK